MAATVTTSRRDDRVELVFRSVVGAAKAYWYVFTVLIGGLAGHYLGAFIVPFLPLPNSWPPARGFQGAWIAGALVVAIGTPLGWFRRRKAPTPADTPPPAEPVDQPIEVVTVTIDRSARNALRTGMSTGLVGAIVGFVLGASLAMMWFSIATSPFAPAAWAQSFRPRTVAVPTSGGTRRMRRGRGTSSPIPLALWFGTAGALGGLGFCFGLIGAPLGWITDETTKKLTRRARSGSGVNPPDAPSSTTR